MTIKYFSLWSVAKRRKSRQAASVHSYCAFLWAGKHASTETPILVADLEIKLSWMSRLTPEWKTAMAGKYRSLKAAADENHIRPGLASALMRRGWDRGCERGFMAEVGTLFEASDSGAGFAARLSELLVAIQPDIDRACDAVEGEKLRLTRDRVLGILD